MAKITGAYKSLVKGVSEQVPQDRLEGQHWEQVNMVSDPIRGLTRRRGSKYRNAITLVQQPELSPATIADLSAFKEFSFYFQGDEFTILYRNRDWADAGYDLQNRGLYCYNKDQARFYNTVESEASLNVLSSGVSSVINVGQYVLLSSRVFRPTAQEVDRVQQTQEKSVAWVRSGDYSRTYSLTVQSRDNIRTVSYTTTTSYYTGTLDTSDIPVLDGNGEVRQQYQKEVNDRVNRYNSQVNQHLAAATKDIQPENIATKLREAAAQVFSLDPTISFSQRGTHIFCDGAISLMADDGGNNSNMVATSQNVRSLDELTKYHHVGKTVRVEITDADPYYVVAEPKGQGTSGWAEVIWREGAGTEYRPDFVFLVATIRGDTLYIGLTPQDLENTLRANGHAVDVPRFLNSEAGDGDSAPLPEMFNRPVSYLGIFQDRLVVVSGAVVFMSRSGDYFSFFRKSVLSVDDDDPIEIYALGSEDDFIRAGAMIDRNFLLFGDRQQYLINGREPMTPRNAFIAVMSSHEGSTDAKPESLGGMLFFTQYRGGRTALMQMQTGAYSDTINSFSVSQQLSTYLKGRPIQIMTASNPQNVILRTEGNRRGFYVYSFLDSPGEEQRYTESWSRWEWDERLGYLVALSMHNNRVLCFTLRKAVGRWDVVVDEFSRESDPDTLPCMDSMAQGDNTHAYVPEEYRPAYWSAVRGDHERSLYGVSIGDRQDLLDYPDVAPEDVWTGVPYHSYFEPTSPYRRDRNDVAILDGRMTLSSLLISVQQSGAFKVDMQMVGDAQTSQTILDLTNWRTNDSRVKLGAVPVRDGQHRVFIGREIREHRLRISAKWWLPLTITTIEWDGQVFSNRRG